MRRSKAKPSSPEDPGRPARDARSDPAQPAPGAGMAGGALRSEAPGTRFSARLSPQNWRVATKLYAILLIPVLVGLVLAGLRVSESDQTRQEADDAEHIAELVLTSTAYAHALIDERDLTAEPLLEGDTDDPVIDEVRNATDQAQEEFWDAAERAPESTSLQRRLDAVEEAEAKLDQIRTYAYTDEMPGVETEESYVEIQHPLMTFANELGLGTHEPSSYGRAVYAISLAKSASSLQRSIGTHMLVEAGSSDKELSTQVSALNSYSYLEGVALEEYRASASSSQAQMLTETLSQASQDAESQDPDAPSLTEMVSTIASADSAEELADSGITVDTFLSAATAEFNAYHRLEQNLVDAAAADAREVAAEARRDVAINSIVVLSTLLLAVVFAGLMARSMSRNMRRLRAAAFEVAGQRLPAMVDQLSRTDPGSVDTRVEPIPLDSRDEIGEVARAFDQVHREAVRLAAEQALLRGNVNAIFTNLSGRNQGLVERQLSLISELENNQADPEQLENLFRLDHLATRMRRNGENLLVLAGEEPERRWNQPIALIDVLRAASSEVESYERIAISGVPDCEIHGAVVSDLVHLLAELLENATVYSSPHTKVRVTATRLPDGRVMIEIHDKGIGLTQEDFAEINDRLAHPPTVDAAISQRMGLFVVGRLAERHGIRIQLRPSGEQSGTTALAMLPETITHGGGNQAGLPEEEFTVSRIVPAAPFAAEADALPRNRPRTAAELGFDDSRYDGAPGRAMGDTVELDSVGRSLQREELRAALESATPPPPIPETAAPAAPGVFDQAPFDQPPYDQGPYQRPSFDQPGPGYDQPAQPYADPAYPVPPSAYESESYGTYEPFQAFGTYGSQDSHQGEQHRQHQQNQVPREEEPPPPGSAPHAPGTESSHDGPMYGSRRVGFTGPDPLAAEYRSTTSAGLPRRERRRPQPEEDPSRRVREEPSARADSRWERGTRRDEQTDGRTTAGLPRRVPRANLAEHALPEPAAGGPQVSRAPEDVRGRLSSLRRGVLRGRGAEGRRGAGHDER